MSVLGLKPKVRPAIARVNELIAARQTAVGRLEAINEADRRVALSSPANRTRSRAR